MALNESPQYAKQIGYGFGIESAYGTAMTSASGLCLWTGLDKVDIDPGIKEYDHRTGLSADPTMQDIIVNTSGSRHTIKVSGMLNQHNLNDLLGCHMQHQAAGIYSYFTTMPTTPRSMTFVVKDPTGVGRDRVYAGCVIKELVLSDERGAKNMIMFDATLESKGPVLNAQTLPAATNWKQSGSKADNYGKLTFEQMQYQISVDNGVSYASAPVSKFKVTMVYSETVQENTDGIGGYAEVAFGIRDGNQFDFTTLAGTKTETLRSGLQHGNGIGFKTVGGLKMTTTGIVTAAPTNVDTLVGMDVTAKMRATGTATNQIQFDRS